MHDDHEMIRRRVHSHGETRMEIKPALNRLLFGLEAYAHRDAIDGE